MTSGGTSSHTGEQYGWRSYKPPGISRAWIYEIASATADTLKLTRADLLKDQT